MSTYADGQQYVSANDVESHLVAILAGIPAQYQRPFSRHYSLLTPSGWWHSGHLISLPSKWSLSIQWHRIKKLCTYFRPNKLPLQLDEIKYLLYLLITENNCRLDPDLRLYISNNNNGENLSSGIHEHHLVTNIDKVSTIKYLPYMYILTRI